MATSMWKLPFTIPITLFPHIIAAATFLFEFIKAWKFQIVSSLNFPYVMKTWIVSSLDEETIQGEETFQGRKLYEEIWYMLFMSISIRCPAYVFYSKHFCIPIPRLSWCRTMILGLTLDISNVRISYACPAQHYKSTTLFWF